MSNFDKKKDQLGHLLTYNQVIRPQQWKRVAGLKKLGDMMDELERQTAWWSPDHPAITGFQRRRIASGEFNRFRDLDRDLRVNNFLLLDELGRGGMGYVHKAWSINFERLVAVKRTTAGNHINRDRLEREARILQLLEHPVIAQYVSWEQIEDGGGFLLAMEYIPGSTLRDYLTTHGQASVEDTVKWGVLLLEALHHAHRLQVVHRDVTPRNIMITQGDCGQTVKLLDFGLGKIREDLSSSLSVPEINFDLTQDNQALGTPQYMSPEVWRDAAGVGGASDLYSLGCNLYEMLTGRTPFSDTTGSAVCIRHMEHEPPDIRRFRSDIPDNLRQVIHRMLEKDPDRRGTPEELIAQLQTRSHSIEQFGKTQAVSATPTFDAVAEVTHDSFANAAAGLQTPALLATQLSPRDDWLRRVIPKSPLSAQARCVEPEITAVEVFEQFRNRIWGLAVIGILMLLCIMWFTMG